MNDGEDLNLELSTQITALRRRLREESVARVRAEADAQRYRAAHDAYPDGVMLLRPIKDAGSALSDFACTYANPAAARLLGRADGELTSKPLLAQIPGPIQATLSDLYTHVLATGQPGARELRHEVGGLDRWIRVTAVKLEGDLAVTLADLTSSRDAEEHAREEARINETLYRIGVSLAAELDRDKLVQQLTDEATTLTRAQFGAFFYNVDDSKGERYMLYTLAGAPREAFSRFPMPRNTAVFEPTFSGREVVRLADVTEDPRYGHNPPYHGMPEGHLPVRSYLAVPVVSRSGEVLGGLFFGHTRRGVFTERDERLAVSVAAQAGVAVDNARLFAAARAAEEELRGSRDALKELNAKLFGLTAAAVEISAAPSLEAALQAISAQARWIIGSHQVVTSMTAGQSFAQAINTVLLSDKYADWRTYNTPSNGEGIYAVVCRENRPMRMTQAELEAHPAWRGFGSEASKHPPMRGWLAAPLVDRHGGNIGLIQLTDKYEGDFTEEDEAILVQLARMASVAIENAKLFDEAQRERARVEEANRTKDEFLATVSHELRTPLNAIVGWLRMLRSGILPPERRERALEIIERNAKAQTQLIEDLLDVSRIISGKLRLNMGLVQLASVIEMALEAVRPAADAKGVRLLPQLEPGAGPLAGDADRLQQVVWNLLTNAVKFTPKGGHVDIRLQGDESNVELLVTDTGQGIRSDFLPFVFERFRQSDASVTRAHGGLGLGLAIVRHLVELHGGTVTAESAGEGQGATFVVRLPVARSQPEPAASAPATSRPLRDDSAPDLDGFEILVVDDEADARELLVTVLQNSGAKVAAAASAAEALDALRRRPPDALVSDIGMPGEDGYSLIRKVRSLPPEDGGDTPAVALTAYARAQDRSRALMAGFNIHVPKPVEPTELVIAIASLLRRSSLP